MLQAGVGYLCSRRAQWQPPGDVPQPVLPQEAPPGQPEEIPPGPEETPPGVPPEIEEPRTPR